MWEHKHPYAPFIPPGTTRLIVGTLPPPRFSLGKLKPGDVHFSYGSSDGYLWPLLDQIYQLNLVYENTPFAVTQRQDFLKKHRLGVCDIVASCKRQKIDASDLGMEDVVLRDFFDYLTAYPTVVQLIFTGGNSKNGPEYFFRKLAKQKQTTLEPLQTEVPRQYRFFWKDRWIETFSLTAPSGAANRAVGSLAKYKALKEQDPEMNTFKFRLYQYRDVFQTKSPEIPNT